MPNKLLLIRKLLRVILRLLPVLVAVGIVIVLVRTRSGPVRKQAAEVGRPLRVIAAPQVALRPKELGYGVAEPRRVWRAMTEVKGPIVSVHPQLEAGALVEAGTILLTIDPADYELAVARLKASVSETQARLGELSAEEQSHKASLQIEKRSLEFAQKSLKRLRELWEKEVGSPDLVDREERKVLQQEQTIQQLDNALAQIPARREALVATLAVHEATLKQAELDLAKTVIRAPFDCRLGNVTLEAGQVLNTGQVLFEAHGTQTVEIEATFRPEQLRNLLPTEKRRQFQPGITMERLQQLFDLTVTIRLRSGDWQATWTARFDRIRETVDPRTRSINVVAVVDDPYGQIVPGVRPALIRGMVCEMELLAPARLNTVVLPRSAVRNGMVFLVDGEGRLRKRSVQVAFAQEDLVVIESGMNGGERVIVSDPTPAIEGMKVDAVNDADLLRRIVRQAQGPEVAP
jgi:RND family efflux transporter MFP subunit